MRIEISHKLLSAIRLIFCVDEMLFYSWGAFCPVSEVTCVIALLHSYFQATLDSAILETWLITTL